MAPLRLQIEALHLALEFVIIFTKHYGAQVIRHAAATLEREVDRAAYNIAGQRDWTYLSPSNDLDVIAGYGTIGLEILEQCKSVNNIFIPMGAGGLISGVGSVIKKFSPNTRVYGVSAVDRMPLADFIDGEYDAEEEYGPSLAASLVTHIDTESETVDLTGGIVHEYLRCTEDEIMRALRMLAFEEKVSVEGSAALALAGFNKVVSELEGDTSVIILSDGNADAELIERVV